MMTWPEHLPRPQMPALRWRFLEIDEGVSKRLEEAGYPRLAAVSLALRGAKDPEEAKAFLEPRLQNLRDPWLMRDMEAAVRRTLRALEAHEPICIYGDYDADGITASALLAKFFRAVGADVKVFLPQRRRDGYGLNANRLLELRMEGASLFIAVDCGTRSVKELKNLRSLGCDVIVLDHHQPGPVLPEAVALVNPNRPDCPFPFKGLAAVGVAFYFVGALRRALVNTEKMDEKAVDLRDFLELVAIGTVADVVPLVEDNRILVHAGIRRINEQPSPATSALLAVSGMQGRPVTSGSIGFMIAPRLNAIGRLGDPRAAFDVLMASNPEEAARLAVLLDRENQARRRVEMEVLTEATAKALECAESHRIIVVHGQGWHPGVVGIVAARLVEFFHKPAVVIGVSDGLGRGSCRSIPGFDIGRAVTALEYLTEHAGGHALAAGVTLKEERLEEFVKALIELGDSQVPEDLLCPTLRVEAVARGPEINGELAELLESFEPYGLGNPEPVYALLGAKVTETRRVGKDGQHLQMFLEHEGVRLPAVWFNGMSDAVSPGDLVDVAFNVERDKWAGSVRLKVRDLKVKGLMP